MPDFTEKFSGYSNTQLLRIIDNPGDYEPSAVETAKVIFASRQLSDDAIEKAKAELAYEKQEKATKEQKKRELEDKAKNMGASVLAALNPLQTEPPSVKRIINSISIVLGGLFLFQVYKDFSLIRYLFTSSAAGWDLSVLQFFLPFILIPAGAILFFLRKKSGWTLLAIFFAYSAVSAAGLLVLILQTKPSGIAAMDQLFPRESPLVPVLMLLFFGGTLLTICTEKIREVYGVDKKYMFTTIIAVALLTAFITYRFLG